MPTSVLNEANPRRLEGTRLEARNPQASMHRAMVFSRRSTRQTRLYLEVFFTSGWRWTLPPFRRLSAPGTTMGTADGSGGGGPRERLPLLRMLRAASPTAIFWAPSAAGRDGGVSSTAE